ncbi:MAG: hypothetical protein HY926_09795 [Elusimicrobia bacterium]|nr:hypothetical protein [Elusimicrobiota bacterium]
MESASSILLIAQLLLSPAARAAAVQTAPVAKAAVSGPLAVGMGMGRIETGPLGAGPLGAGRLILSPASGLFVPAVQPGLTAAPAEAVQAAAAILSVLPEAAAPQAAAPEQAEDGQAGALDSLQEAAEPRQPGRTQETAAPALFDGSRKAETKDWTFMVFLNGHNNLDRFGEMNIKQMEKVGSNDRVNIVVQWASLGKTTKRLLIQRSEDGRIASPVVEELPAVDMGSADQLSEFIRWTAEKFPASRYMIDLWDHGAGWHAKKQRGAVSPLDISWDDQTGNHITTEQLGDVMRKAAALIGHPIDVLGFDACLMAMAEVMAQVADSVHYLAASEQTEPGAGWPYEKVLKAWLAAEADDGLALVKALTEHYVANYPRDVAFSGVDLTKLPVFMEAVRALGRELAGLDAAKFAQARKAAQRTQRYAYSDYGDFLDFVVKLPADVVTAPVIAAVTAAYQALVVANAATPDIKGSTGASVWLPMSSYLWQQYGARYLGLAWHKLTEWGGFVKRLSGA